MEMTHRELLSSGRPGSGFTVLTVHRPGPGDHRSLPHEACLQTHLSRGQDATRSSLTRWMENVHHTTMFWNPCFHKRANLRSERSEGSCP
jgi:hypothetical protein